MMRRRGRVLVALLAILGIALGLAGCSTTRQVRMKDELDRLESHVRMPRGQAIVGYIDSDAFYHQYPGRVRLVGDSLEFFSELRPSSSSIWDDLRERGYRVPRSAVSTIFIQHLDPLRTTLAVIGTTVLVLGVLVAIIIATKESCPFIYSWDGQRYVFDGEPYGGATMKALERTDWSELEHLVPARGEYRLMLTNEVDETQHTNRLGLLVVDHPRGTTVVMDREGRAHAFRRTASLAVAHDEAGHDLLPWLRATDKAAWYPRLDTLALRDSIVDTRSHITLEFARPAGASRVFLISNVATGQWGSHMIRTMLGMRGDRVQEFYAAINGSDEYRRQLLDWNRREELFELFFEVRCGDRWVRQDFIPGGGPFISENRAIPLDLSGVTGDRIEIRLHPPIGFWSLNSFRLGWDEADAKVTELSPATGSGAGAANVVEALRAADGLYLDFPNRGDRAELTFKAPPAVPGMQRTVFAQTSGWYEVHLHDLGAPDVAGLQRLTLEPGYIVRRALQEYAEYRRTGILKGAAAMGAEAGGQ
jgi:hypothetical protein